MEGVGRLGSVGERLAFEAGDQVGRLGQDGEEGIDDP